MRFSAPSPPWLGLRLKKPPLPWVYVITVLVLIVLFEVLPYVEELARGIRKARDRSGPDTFEPSESFCAGATNAFGVPMRVERWPIDRLTPYAGNARTHSEKQIGQIAASIRERGRTRSSCRKPAPSPPAMAAAQRPKAGHGENDVAHSSRRKQRELHHTTHEHFRAGFRLTVCSQQGA